MAKKETGRTIRVRHETYAKFRAALERLELAAADNRCPSWWTDELTADQFVAKLIERHEAHRRRAREHRRRLRDRIRVNRDTEAFVPVKPWHSNPHGVYSNLPSAVADRAGASEAKS